MDLPEPAGPHMKITRLMPTIVRRALAPLLGNQQVPGDASTLQRFRRRQPTEEFEAGLEFLAVFRCQ